MDQVQQAGWVYLMRNRSIPDMVKIGWTANDPSERARQLSSPTGVPYPFYVVKAFSTNYPKAAESYIFERHHYLRVNPNREFFKACLAESSYMISDSEYDEYYSILIQNGINYVELQMKIHALRKQINELEAQHIDMHKLHINESAYFLEQCQKRNFPEKWAERKERLRKAFEAADRHKESSG